MLAAAQGIPLPGNGWGTAGMGGECSPSSDIAGAVEQRMGQPGRKAVREQASCGRQRCRDQAVPGLAPGPRR